VSVRSPSRDAAPSPARRAIARGRAVRSRYEASWAGEIGRQLKALDFVNWITMFGAALLWSVLPLLILLSSFADRRIDDDISRHIGLNSQGSHIVETLFRGTPAHGVEPILTGFLFCFGGVVAVASSLQLIYERVFGQEPRGWHNLPRGITWIAAVIALLAVDGAVNGPIKHDGGSAAVDLLGLVTTTLFFWWTMHYLLAGRVAWRRLVRPALTSGVLWLGFGFFSTAYFSPILISDSHTYGTIGVVFSLLTWFFLIGAVVVLGVVSGAVWQAHAENR
jgi:membrane protein